MTLALALRRFARDLTLLLSYVVSGLIVLALLTWRGLVPNQIGSAAAAGGGVAIALALASAARYRLADAALALDRRAGLRERATTALEMIATGRESHPLSARVIAEAETGAGTNPLRLFPYALGRRALALAAMAAVLASVLSLPPRPLPTAVGAPPVPRAAGRKISEPARAVEKLAAGLGEQEVAEAARRIAISGDRITAGRGDREEVVREIRSARTETERYVRRSQSPGPALERARTGLNSRPSTRELGHALAAGDPAAVKQAMQALAQSMTGGGFDRKSLTQVGKNLADLAGALASGDLQKLVDQAARAAAAGDGENLSRLLDEARRVAASTPPRPDAPRGIPAPEKVGAMLERAAGDAAKARSDDRALSEPDLGQLASSLEHLAEAMEQAGEKDLARELGQAAESARSGEREQLSRQLSALAERVPQALARMNQGRKQAESLAALLHQTEALLGLGRAAPLGQADYGVGSTDEEAKPFAVGSERHNRDREMPLRTDTTRDYTAPHTAKMLDHAKFEATRVDGMHGDGEMSYVEYRAPALPGRVKLAREVLPGTMAEGVEEALTRESIPPAYRQQIRKYFDTGAGAGREEER